MKIAIHQPNYLPWLGYFYKIWVSEKFVFHDNVEYTKKSFTKRVCIRKYPDTDTTNYLSVPLKHHSDFELIKDLKICNNINWREKHLNKVYYVYHRAPFFDAFFPMYKQILTDKNPLDDTLVHLNTTLIKAIMQVLGINTPLYYSSHLPISVLKADFYNAEIAQFLGGTHYVSGTGAQNYQSQLTYESFNVQLDISHFNEFIHQVPPQYPVPFLPYLSILDALFYLGAQEINALFQRCYEHEALLRNNHTFSPQRLGQVITNWNMEKP